MAPTFQRSGGSGPASPTIPGAAEGALGRVPAGGPGAAPLPGIHDLYASDPSMRL
ncbi:hypothetical protein [Streptomyces sp. BK022]|uniref:hypothetical protein n=1 Tax=Streptomyces sp. BK022 TaxID=2512123 RepID=UPI0013EF0345|nr:hypothetical protein [Streptomyces sp. BK022]